MIYYRLNAKQRTSQRYYYPGHCFVIDDTWSGGGGSKLRMKKFVDAAGNVLVTSLDKMGIVYDIL